MVRLYGEQEDIEYDKVKDFHSSSLDDDYNTIYRTKEEFISFFEKLNYNGIEMYGMFMDTNEHDDYHVSSYVLK